MGSLGWRKIRRDLGRSKLLFIAVVALLAVGIAIYVAIYSAFQNLRASENATYDQLRLADITVRIASTRPEELDQANLDAIDGIDAIERRTVRDLPMRWNGSDEVVTARLISVPDSGRPAVNDVLVQSGLFPPDGDANGVLLDDQFAQARDLSIGDTVSIAGGPDLVLRGTFVSPEYIWKSTGPDQPFVGKGDFAVAIARVSAVQQITGDAGFNEIAALFDANADENSTGDALTAALTPFGIESVTPRSDQISYSLLKLDLDGFRQIGIVTPILFLAITAMVVYVLLSRIVQSQRSIIGTLRAVGFGRTWIVTHYLAFALTIAAVGVPLGLVLGLGLASAITSLYTDAIGIPITRSSVSAPVLLIGVGVGFLVSLGACAIPALYAARMSPAEAMRPAPAPAPHSRFFETALRRMHPPYPIRLALRNLTRSRIRSVSSVLGIAVSVGLVLASFGMMDAMNRGLDRQFNDVRNYDVNATFISPRSASEMNKYAAWDGVATSEPSLVAPVTITHGATTVNATLTGVPAGTDSIRLRRADGAEPFTADGLFLSSGMANRLGVSAGDSVTLSSQAGEASVTVAGTVDQDLTAGVYATLEYIGTLLSSPTTIANSALITVQDKSDKDAVISALQAEPGILSVETPGQLEDSFRQLMSLFYEFVGIFVLFSIVLAVFAVFNNVTINITERRQEIATMLTVGFGARHIDLMLTVEHLVLAAAGIPLGILIGRWLEILLLGLFKTELFSIGAYTAPLTYALIGVFSAIVLVLAQAPGLRSIRHMDLAGITKERAS